MKDMYSFDTNLESSRITYNEICQSYHKIFERIGVRFVQGLLKAFLIYLKFNKMPFTREN